MPAIEPTPNATQKTSRLTSNSKSLASKSKRKSGTRRLRKTIKPRSPTRSAQLTDGDFKAQDKKSSQISSPPDLYSNKATQTQCLSADGIHDHIRTEDSQPPQTRHLTDSHHIPAVWNERSPSTDHPEDMAIEQRRSPSEKHFTLTADSDLGGVRLDPVYDRNVDERMDFESQAIQSRTSDDGEQETSTPEGLEALEGPPFTDGESRIVLANDGFKGCLALLLTSEMVAKINQIATRSRRLEYITAKSITLKQEIRSAENLVEYKTDALQDTDDQVEIARIKEDIEKAQKSHGEAAKRLEVFEDEIDTLTTNLGFSREQSQEVLEDVLAKMDLLNIPEPEFAGETRPKADVDESEEQTVYRGQQPSVEPCDWVEEANRREYDEIDAARLDFEEKRNALAELDDMFEHRQDALAEERAEYHRCVEEGICHITQTDFDLMDLQDFGKLTGRLKKAQEDFEYSFERVKKVGALDERDAHYQESVFSEWSGGYPMSLEDAMVDSAPSKRISLWQETLAPSNLGPLGGRTGIEPWGAPNTEPEKLEMEDCDIKSAAISDSWSCVDRSRNRRRIDRWREIAGRDRMSRRPPNPAAERAAQNQQTIKTLLKLEGNKSCADCKRNKPSKIENFIRTKYESKRWVMDGPMPDPSALDAEGDDDVPLNVVQEKAKMERSSSQRLASASSQPAKPTPKPAPNIDLFGDIPAPPARPSTTDTPNVRPPPSKEAAAPSKQQKQGDSLLGLDFFGGPPSAPSARPASAASTAGATAQSSRPDLKQSILSLYSSGPRTQSQPQSYQESQDIFGGMQSPPPQQPSASSGLGDAFSSLSFGPTSPPSLQTRPAPNDDPFASFSKPSAQRSTYTSPPVKSPPQPSGGSFFDSGPKKSSQPATASKPPAQTFQSLRTPSASNGLGDFDFSPTTTPTTKPSTKSASNDLFDFSGPLPPQSVMPSKPAAPSINLNSAFNLSAPAPPPQPAAKSAPLAPTSSTTFPGFANDDPWGSNNAWANPEPATATKPKTESKSPAIPTTSDFSSWGNSTTTSNFGGGNSIKDPPTIAADEDFGGWNSAAPVTPAASNPPPTKPSGGGLGGSEDLFSNVWQ
ncbi:MAG: hypothetical protein Q9212_002897 [Teloschistes hypoglaucus]